MENTYFVYLILFIFLLNACAACAACYTSKRVKSILVPNINSSTELAPLWMGSNMPTLQFLLTNVGYLELQKRRLLFYGMSTTYLFIEHPCEVDLS